MLFTLLVLAFGLQVQAQSNGTAVSISSSISSGALSTPLPTGCTDGITSECYDVCQTNLVGDGDDFPSDNDGDEIAVADCATYCSSLGINPYSTCSSTSTTSPTSTISTITAATITTSSLSSISSTSSSSSSSIIPTTSSSSSSSTPLPTGCTDGITSECYYVCQTNLVGDGDDFPSDNDGDEIAVADCATYCSSLGINPYSTCSSTSMPSSSSSLTHASCGPACQVDGFGTILVFPTKLVASPYYQSTVHIQTTIYLDGITRTSTTTIQATPSQVQLPPTLTWQYHAVALTYPTTYVAYTDFSHISVISDGTCTSSSTDLTLASSNWASLIYPTGVIPPGLLLPPALVNYLDSDTAVQSELGGTVVSNCDPQAGPTQAAASATETLTTAEIVGQLTTTNDPPTSVNTPYAQVQADTRSPAGSTPATQTPAGGNPSATSASSSGGGGGSSTGGSSTTKGTASTSTTTGTGPAQQTINIASRIFRPEAYLAGVLPLLLFFV